MKTYILRDPQAVEPQNRKRNPWPNLLRDNPVVNAQWTRRLDRARDRDPVRRNA